MGVFRDSPKVLLPFFTPRFPCYCRSGIAKNIPLFDLNLSVESNKKIPTEMQVLLSGNRFLLLSLM